MLALAAPASPAFAQGVDIQFTKSGPATATPGVPFTYTLEATNAGTVSSDPLFISDPLPPEVVYVSHTTETSSFINCNFSSGTIFCFANGLLQNEFHRVFITVQLSEEEPPQPGTTFTNTATIEHSIGDGAPENAAGPQLAIDPSLPKTASHAVAIPGPDVTIAKSHTGNGTRGQQLTYSIVATNVGSGPTLGTTTVTDTLPAGLTPVSFSGAGWTCTLAPLQCTHPAGIGAGSPFPTLSLVVAVQAGAADLVVNSVSVSLPGEVNTANNTATDPTTIVSPPLPPVLTGALTLGLSFSSPTYYAAGQLIQVSYLVTNPGTAAVNTIVVTDPKVPVITCPQTALAVGASMTCTGPYTTTAADITAGISRFTASVTGSGGATATASGAITSLVGAVQSAFNPLTPMPVIVNPPGLHDRVGASSMSLTESAGDPTLNFAASFLAGAGEAAAELATGTVRAPFKLWIDGTFTLHTANNGGGHSGILGLGGDYLVDDDLLVGVALYLDTMSRTVGTGTLKGRGFVAGPYISVAITPHITIDASLFYGGSTQDAAATVFGIPFTGSYTTQRIIARGKLDGLWNMNAFVVRPDATFYLSHESAGGYTVRDAQGNGVAIAGFTNIYLDLSGGTRVERPIDLENGLVLIPFVGARIGVGGQGATVSLNDPYGTASAGFILEGDTWKFETSVEGSLFASSLRTLRYKAGISGEF